MLMDVEPERIGNLGPGRPEQLLPAWHLLREHRELHALWVILTQGKKGSAQASRDQTLAGQCCRPCTDAMKALVAEMGRRGYRHNTPLPAEQATGLAQRDGYTGYSGGAESKSSDARAAAAGSEFELKEALAQKQRAPAGAVPHIQIINSGKIYRHVG